MKISTDSVAKIDTLGRDKFAEQIVRNIRFSFPKNHDGIVLGISGEWGSGKSSLLGFLSKQIDAQYLNDSVKPIKINFNSWANSGEDRIERLFLGNILQAVEHLSSKRLQSKSREKLRHYLSYLKKIDFLKNIGGYTKGIFETADAYINDLPSLDSIKELINGIICENEVKIYILIDDVDRLLPTEIVSLFKILKVNLNINNAIFIIAYDREVVIKSLNDTYGFDGEKYLEKIVQIDFAIPNILKYQIENVFFDKLTEYSDLLNISYKNTGIERIWRLQGLSEYFKSIRDVNRFFNNLAFSLPNIVNDVDLEDFIILEAIRTFDSSAYYNLYDNMELTFRRMIWESINFDDFFFSHFKNPTTEALIRILLTDNIRKVIPLEKRFRDREFFQRFFSLIVSERHVSYGILNEFFAKGSQKSNVLRTLLGEGKINVFFEDICNITNEFKFSNEDIFVFRTLSEFWNDVNLNVPFATMSLSIKAYFKFISLFENQTESAKAAIENILFTNGVTQRNRFKFVISQMIVDKAIPSVKHDDRGLLSVYLDQITDSFKNYTKEEHHASLVRIEDGKGDWFDLRILNALAIYFPEDYFKKISNNINNPNLLYFICSSYFMYDATTGDVGALTGNNYSLFLPGDLLKLALNSIITMNESLVTPKQLKGLKFFFANAKIN